MSDTERPLVTIAIPTYTRADGYLPGATDSALAQTYIPLEILISDNCSTEGTDESFRSGERAAHRVLSASTEAVSSAA